MDTVLVTGIGGYVGLHVARALLDAGYAVRGTVRSARREDAVRRSLGASDRLSFVEADLVADAGWVEAARGCRFVAHVASPFPASAPRDEGELIVPAREGTLRVLRAAKEVGVERVVLTSSMAAVFVGHPRERTAAFTEADWTPVDSPTTDPYSKSKTLAERAAWDFAKTSALPVVAINPPYIFGPVLGGEISTSLLWFTKLMNRAIPGCPNLTIQCVDVRDVAALHVRALTAADAVGQRFCAVAHSPSVVEVARRLAEAFPAHRIPTRVLPDVAVRLVALFDKEARLIVPSLGQRLAVDSGRATRVLGFSPLPIAQTVTDTARSLIEHGTVPRRS